MTPYRLTPRLDAEPPPAPKRSFVRAAVALSAAAHVALLVACAMSAPRSPEPPRTSTVRVLQTEVTTSDTGETACRMNGFATAVVRSAP